jgi:peptidyl-tRNA hydrolase ICT1
MKDLETVMPKILYQGLRASSYYVASNDLIRIKCDEHRSQTQNKLTSYQRLAHEVEKIFRAKVPGVTTAGKKEKVIAL